MRVFVITACLIAMSFYDAYGQVLIGPRVGGLYYRHRYEETGTLSAKNISSDYDFGYTAGVALIYTLAEKFAMHTEILYSHKGKKLTGGLSGEFSHKATYQYLEFPLGFQYMFKGKVYTWYIRGGGNFSYWLSGKGVIKSLELSRHVLPPYAYDIVFNPAKVDHDSPDINLSEPNRIQAGLDIGVGVLLSTLHPKNKIIVDLKYQYGHSWLAGDKDFFLGIDEYQEDFRSSYSTVSLSVGYLFGFDLGQGKEGKSTDKTRKSKKK